IAANSNGAAPALPRPFIDLRHEMEFEQRVFEGEFPDLADIDRPRTPEQWDALLKKFRTKVQRIRQIPAEGEQPKPAPPGSGPNEAAATSPYLAAAKRYLAERRGMT